MDLQKYIDHTLLKATAIPSEIEKLCLEALEYNFYAVCVNGSYVSYAKTLLRDSDVKVAAVIGFPLGAMATEAKVFETKQCINDGADEIDMVIHLGKLIAGDEAYVEKEIAAIKEVVGSRILKVIIETCYLTDAQKEKACVLAKKAGADFVKTSTGFGTGGATLHDVALMKKTVGEDVQVKASGGIKDKETAQEYIALGVDRIGTSSGIQIVS